MLSMKRGWGVTKGGSVKGCHEREWCHEEGSHEREVLRRGWFHEGGVVKGRFEFFKYEIDILLSIRCKTGVNPGYLAREVTNSYIF